jgi:uncharacterized damage-inducible protein DinB
MNEGELFLARSRYYLSGEYLPKIRKCIEALPPDAIWRRANESSNSIGNLLLHLAGNVSQWIVEGIGGKAVHRDRPSEFSARGGWSDQALIDNLDRALADADSVLAGLTPADLTRPYVMQERDNTVLTAIYHVVEHFAMHTGQIVLLAKTYAPDSIHFYDDSSGAARPLWGGSEGMPGAEVAGGSTPVQNEV